MMRERDAAAWEQVRNRPADWTCPDGETYDAPGPVGADAPCCDWCIEGRCSGSTHRVLGSWTPNADNTAWTFRPSRLPGEDDEALVARQHKEMAPAMRRAMRDNDTLRAWADDKGKPAASLYCRAQAEDGSRCSRKVANLYRRERTYLVADGWYYTFPEARVTQLNAALAAREQGHHDIAAVHQAWADVKRTPLCITLDPRSKDDPLYHSGGRLPFDFLLIGCEHHGDVITSYGWLREAGRKGGHTDIDPQTSRLYVLPSEMPTEG